MNKVLEKRLFSITYERGWILVAAIIVILFLSAIGFSASQLVTVQYQHTKIEEFGQNAQLVAEAGVEQTVNQLNSNSSFAGYSTPQTFFNDTTQGKGVFTTVVANIAGSNAKTVTSTGKIYRNSNNVTPTDTRKVRVTVVGTQSTGNSVIGGPGGLILTGNASITNGAVYVNGMVTMSGHATIGTSSNPLAVNVADDACPNGANPGPTYPTVCTSGQPISLSGNPHIYGAVCATNQTTGTSYMTNTGLTAGCTAPTVTPPVYNRSAVIGGIPGGNIFSGTSGTYACTSNKSITLPANTELTGSTVSWASSCTITVSGNVYIPGNLSVGGSVKIKVADTVGTTRPIVVVDGTISVGGSSSMAANASGTGIDYVSFANCIGGTNASCNHGTSNPAATPTGTDLYNSQQQLDVSIGGSSNLPGMIFDAYWSEITESGSGHVGAIAGQTVNMSGAGTVIFGTSLSSGTQTWAVTSYQQLTSNQ